MLLALARLKNCVKLMSEGGRLGIWAPAHWCLGEIYGLLVSQAKLLNLITGKSIKSEPAQEKRFSQTIHI